MLYQSEWLNAAGRLALCALLLIVPVFTAVAGGQDEEVDPEEEWTQPEAPELAALVEAGELPPLEERIPSNPMVIEPENEIGRYGGEVRSSLMAAGDMQWLTRTVRYDGLVVFDKNFDEVIPSMAESYEVNDDATEFTFTLREGLRWSDGEPLTSADFEWFHENVVLHEDLVTTLDVHDWPHHDDSVSLWNSYDSVLEIPADDYLSRCLPVSFRDPGKGRVVYKPCLHER